MSDKKRTEKERIIDYLNISIGTYFVSQRMYEECTLGEHLYLCMKELMPTPFLEHLLNGKDDK